MFDAASTTGAAVAEATAVGAGALTTGALTCGTATGSGAATVAAGAAIVAWVGAAAISTRRDGTVTLGVVGRVRSCAIAAVFAACAAVTGACWT